MRGNIVSPRFSCVVDVVLLVNALLGARQSSLARFIYPVIIGNVYISTKCTENIVSAEMCGLRRDLFNRQRLHFGQNVRRSSQSPRYVGAADVMLLGSVSILTRMRGKHCLSPRSASFVDTLLIGNVYTSVRMHGERRSR